MTCSSCGIAACLAPRYAEIVAEAASRAVRRSRRAPNRAASWDCTCIPGSPECHIAFPMSCAPSRRSPQRGGSGPRRRPRSRRSQRRNCGKTHVNSPGESREQIQDDLDQWPARLRLSRGSLKAGLTRDPHLIGVDGGSTDPGPYYLGSGKPVNSRIAMKRDIGLMLSAAIAQRIPLVIGSCGGAGGEPHLQLVVDIVRELAREQGHRFKMAVIHAEQDGRHGQQPAEAGCRAPAAQFARHRRDRPSVARAASSA